jgi:hypothetical protein
MLKKSRSERASQRRKRAERRVTTSLPSNRLLSHTLSSSRFWLFDRKLDRLLPAHDDGFIERAQMLQVPSVYGNNLIAGAKSR